jgi:multidrug efflux pump subunit AcrA (membrane-fusion protein)
LLAAVCLAAGCGVREEGQGDGGERWVAAERREVRPAATPVRCELAARRVVQVSSPLPGAAVLEWVAEEGTRVEEGDEVARFDASQWEQDALKLSNEWFRARQERLALENAELPLERLELEEAAQEAAEAARAEAEFGATAKGLAERGLMGEGEVERQYAAADAASAKAEKASRRLELAEKHLHPARLAKARAAEEAAERQWKQAAGLAEACRVRAPAAGVASLVPLWFNGEWRPAQVGDSLARNQAFLKIADPREAVLSGAVGEGDLAAVREGWRAEGRPAAFPGVALKGRVESVGTVARVEPQGGGRRAFPVRIGVEGADGALPLGVTVDAWVFPPEETDAVTIPRSALEWHDGAAGVVMEGNEWRAVELGGADGEWVVVRSGLAEGERVRVP